MLARSFGCARFVHNDTLRFRTDAYYKDGTSISHSKAEKRLVSLKSEFPFLKDVSSVILQQTLRDQQEAFKNFWAGRAKARLLVAKAHERVGFARNDFQHKLSRRKSHLA